eukprot:maker-scaffold_67-snap-gene-0.6-mRNA-1 protein AED:0.07 eAED:0.07 QI:32/1/1/1/1/1/5/39/210
MNNEDINLTLVLVGDSGVGKTCILQAYCNHERFSEGNNQENFEAGNYNNFVEKIAGNNFLVQIKLGNKCNLCLDLRDTTGIPSFAAIRQLCYYQVSAFICCYSMNNISTLENIKNFWIPEISRKQFLDISVSKEKYFPLVLVGNNSDLELNVDNKRFMREKANRIISEYNGICEMTCTVNNINTVREVFNRVAGELYSRTYNKNKTCSIL